MILLLIAVGFLGIVLGDHHQPLSFIDITSTNLHYDGSTIFASPRLLGIHGNHAENVIVTFRSKTPSNSDWIGVFSPAILNTTLCPVPYNSIFENHTPTLCSSPIKFKYANYSNIHYAEDGFGKLSFRLINQRQGFSFGLFTGGLLNPTLIAISNVVEFKYPKLPLYPRIALGKNWNEVSITWTSGCNDTVPYVQWGRSFKCVKTAYAMTTTYSRSDMCGTPANTVGWRDPGYIHTVYLTNLVPSTKYYYIIVHENAQGSVVYKGLPYTFKSPPAPGQSVVQQLIFFGDMGKAESDGSLEYYMDSGALNTTKQLENDIQNIDLVMDMGDISYANGYLAQWDQYTEQITKIASSKPWMVASGNHERDWFNSGSFYNSSDSGGECGVPSQIMFNMPAENRATPWYKVDFGMFRICVADTESDWRRGSRQYNFLENCFATTNRQMQPWLLFVGHRVLGYSSSIIYGNTYAEPNGRDDLQVLWQKYKVDLGMFGHAHNYERTCPVYNGTCQSEERDHYSGTYNGTIHVVAGGGGGPLFGFKQQTPTWTIAKDQDFGFVKLTSYGRSHLRLEYKKSSNGQVYDSFVIRRKYKDVLGCDAGQHYCPPINGSD